MSKFIFLLALACLPSIVSAQKIFFPSSLTADSTQWPAGIKKMAYDVLHLSTKKKTSLAAEDVMRCQVLSQRYNEALRSIDSIRNIGSKRAQPFASVKNVIDELYARSKQQQININGSFQDIYSKLFKQKFGTLTDQEANHILYDFFPLNTISQLKENVQQYLNSLGNGDSITVEQSGELFNRYYQFIVFKEVFPMSRKLYGEDDKLRYIIEDSVMIHCKTGVTISAVVVRSKKITTPQPAILEFTIYTGAIMALGKDAAAHGYAGVIAFTRGKRYSPDEIVPYEHDGEDANEVIDWISKQSWCNGKVGMYGGSYTGFTQWAATKKLHPALRTIVPAASVAPGVDVPMMNNVFESFVFNWIYYVTNNRYLDIADYNNTAKWDSLFATWYREGLPYHSLDSLTGRGKNKVFQSWIAHPTYDAYWQAMIPYKEDFAKINIPVLSFTGYYDGGQVGAMYYFREHYKYNRNANHCLVIGPFSHYGSQGFLGAMPDSVLQNYRVDPKAIIPIHDIIFQWFDYIFRDGNRPSILADKVNYQVMGTNEWKHKPSLNKIANDTIRFYLTDKPNGKYLTLSKAVPATLASVSQTVDFRDRKTMNNYNPVVNYVSDSIDLSNGIAFLSAPFDIPVEFTGNFFGTLQFVVNKKDFDYSLNVYEVLPDGKYFYLTYFMGRASYAGDVEHRNLLTPGKLQKISFTNSYFTSCKLSKRSRLLVVLNINKSSNEQINYGTGKEVSDESMQDANEPLKIRWSAFSTISIPVWK